MLAIPPAAPARAAGETLRAKEIAAGYEAIFLCSDTFVGHMSEAAIDDTDLAGKPRQRGRLKQHPAAGSTTRTTISCSPPTA